MEEAWLKHREGAVFLIVVRSLQGKLNSLERGIEAGEHKKFDTSEDRLMSGPSAPVLSRLILILAELCNYGSFK